MCVQGKKKAQKQALAAELGDMDWDGERERAVRALLQLLQLNIYRLWDPPVAEEEFVKLVICTVFMTVCQISFVRGNIH